MTPATSAINDDRANWSERHARIGEVASLQLFFVGGVPRSGTTWLQILLDSHPEISCRGEGLFGEFLAKPIDAIVATRVEAISNKNRTVFGGMAGYPLGGPADADQLLGTAVLLELARQAGDKSVRAIGEKTPENVFFFPRLKRLFPKARFIGIARDPRDALASAWHYFKRARGSEDGDAAKSAYLRCALPSWNQGTRSMLSLVDQYRPDAILVTYEALKAHPADMAARLFDFLGVTTGSAIVGECVRKASFERLTGGRPAGIAQDGSFFRKGVPGDWQSTLTPAMSDLVLSELGWAFPYFGWTP